MFPGISHCAGPNAKGSSSMPGGTFSCFKNQICGRRIGDSLVTVMFMVAVMVTLDNVLVASQVRSSDVESALAMSSSRSPAECFPWNVQENSQFGEHSAEHWTCWRETSRTGSNATHITTTSETAVLGGRLTDSVLPCPFSSSPPDKAPTAQEKMQAGSHSAVQVQTDATPAVRNAESQLISMSDGVFWVMADSPVVGLIAVQIRPSAPAGSSNTRLSAGPWKVSFPQIQV
ncbi:hypothetical protein EYF80_046495 [Liparis tanakae]|uniref:Uncharacterized protein n=1 Tax=Liparis tanakae TaxID=230148 RepID=A0A4Z2FQ87_9TELE|nr:hypothetical protein EYF80_046495 [Liparis tanakae]